MAMRGCWKCAGRPPKADESRLLCDECSLLNVRLGSTDLATFGSYLLDTSKSISTSGSSRISENTAPDSREGIARTTPINSVFTASIPHETTIPGHYGGYIPPDDRMFPPPDNDSQGGAFDWDSGRIFTLAEGCRPTGQASLTPLTFGEVPLDPFEHRTFLWEDRPSHFLDFPGQLESLMGVSMSPICQQGFDSRGKFEIPRTPYPSLQLERNGTHSAPGMSHGQHSLYQALLSLEYTPDESTAHSSTTQDSSTGSPAPTKPWPNFDDMVESADKDDDPEGIGFTMCGVLSVDSAVESNSLPFVLQSYANWMKMKMFDPSRTAHRAKDYIIQRYVVSSQSRCWMILAANILRAFVVSSPNYRSMLSLLMTEIRQNLIESKGHPLLPIRDSGAVPLIPALNLTLELHIFSLYGPLHDALQVLSDVAPILRRVCTRSTSQYIPLLNILTHPDPNVRGYPAVDALYSMLTGLPTRLKYDATFRLKPNAVEYTESLATRLIGQPYELTIVLARIGSLHDDFGVDIDPFVVEEIESDIRDFRPDPGTSPDPSLTVMRLVVLEAWRQVGYINLYMRLCGESALGPRVQAAHRRLMDLVANSKSSHRANLHLSACLAIAGLAATRTEERNLVLVRLQSLPHSRSDSFLNRGIQMLQDIWMRTDSEGRPAQWSDLRAATQRIIGI